MHGKLWFICFLVWIDQHVVAHNLLPMKVCASFAIRSLGGFELSAAQHRHRTQWRTTLKVIGGADTQHKDIMV